MPEPSDSKDETGGEQQGEEMSYFEFRPYRDAPPLVTNKLAQRVQTPSAASNSSNSKLSRPDQMRPAGHSVQNKPPERQQDSAAVRQHRYQPAASSSGHQPTAAAVGKSDIGGGGGGGKHVQKREMATEQKSSLQVQTSGSAHSGAGRSSSPGAPLDRSAVVGQQPNRGLDKQSTKITVSHELEEHWMPDRMCHECSECGVKFGIFVRKHHCRICGRIFCSNCSSHTVPAYHLRNDLNGTLRVCLDCFKIYQRSQNLSKEGCDSVPLRRPSQTTNSSSSLSASLPDIATATHDSEVSIPPLLSVTATNRHSWDERSSIMSTPDIVSSPSRSSTIEFDNPVFFRRSLIRHKALTEDRETDNILALTEDEVEICLEEIWKKMDDPVQGIVPQTHRYRWHTFPQSFAARQIVEWLLRHGHAYSREMAVRIGQALVHTKFLVVVSSTDQLFRDVDGIFLEVGEAGKLPSQAQPTLPMVADAPNWFLSDEGEEPMAAKPVTNPPSVQLNTQQNGHEAELNVDGGTVRFKKLRRTFGGGQRKFKKKTEAKKDFISSLPALIEPHPLPPPPDLNEQDELSFEKPPDKKEEERKENVKEESVEEQAPQVTVPTSSHDEDLALLVPELWLPDLESNTNMSFSFIDQQAVSRALPFGLPKATESAHRGRERDELRNKILSGHEKYLDNMMVQLLKTFGLSLSWLKILRSLILEGCKKVKMDVYNDDFMDIRHYIKVKKIPGGQKSACSFVSGVVFSKHVTHKKMQLSFRNPRILLLKCALEFQRHDNQLSSFDTLLNQEEQYLKNLVERIKKCRPNIILVQKSVSRSALEMLHHHGIVVVLNVKPAVMARVSRGTQGQLLYSLDQLSFKFKLGTCGHFYVKSFTLPDDTRKTLMYFDECDPKLGGVITLQGGLNQELKRVKQVANFGLHIAQNMGLESSFLADEFAEPSQPVPDCMADNDDGYTTPPSTPELVMFPFSPYEQMLSSLSTAVEGKEKEINTNAEEKMAEDENNGGVVEAEEKTETEKEADTQPALEEKEEGKEESLEELGKDAEMVAEDPPDPNHPEDKVLPSGTEKVDSEDPIDSCKPASEEDPLPKHTQQVCSAERAFEEVLKTHLISSSPHISFTVPYLESKKGLTANVRRYLPQEIYWSHSFNPRNISQRRTSNAHFYKESQPCFSLRTNSHSLYSQYGIEPATKHSYKSVSNHPLTSSIFLLPANSPEVKAVMADFRARSSIPDEPNCFFFPGARKGADIYSQMRWIFSKSKDFELRAKHGGKELGVKRKGSAQRVVQPMQSTPAPRHPVRRAKRWSIPEKSKYSSTSSSGQSINQGHNNTRDILDYVMQKTHHGDSTTESLVELEIPRMLTAVFDRQKTSPEPGQRPPPKEEERKSPTGEWSILMEEQLVPDTDERDCLDPFNHQFIALQFSSTCHDGHKRPYPCVLPCMIPMNYYGRNDIPLGEFLRRYCFRDDYVCQACNVDMSHHQRHFVHRNMELRVTMQRLPSPIPGSESGQLLTWLTCKHCSESTPLIPMAEESLCLSFAKFLDLKFYASSYTLHCHSNTTSTCTHPLHSNYIQYFCYQQKVAAFEPLQSVLLEVAIPPQKITMATSTDHVQFHHDYIHEITHLGKLIEAIFYRFNQYLLLYGTVDGIASNVQDNIDRSKTVRASLHQKVKEMKELSIASGLVQPSWVLREEGEEVQSFYTLQDCTAELKRQIADMVLVWNLELETLDSKARELRDAANKKENLWESFNATPASAIDETSPSVSAVSSSSPYASPLLRHKCPASEGTASPHDQYLTSQKKEDGEKEQSRSNNLCEDSTHLQPESTDSKHHRRNLSDSVTLARSSSVDESSSEAVGVGEEESLDSSDGGKPSKLGGGRQRHVRHHSLTESVKTRDEVGKEESGELLKALREGDVHGEKWVQQQRAITEEVTDFVNKLRGKEIEDPAKFYSIRSTQMNLLYSDDTRIAPRSSPVASDETEATSSRRTPLSGGVRKTLMEKISLLLSKPFQKLPSPFDSCEHHMLRGNLKFTVAVYENEPTSIIAYALCSREYASELNVLQQEGRRKAEGLDTTSTVVQPPVLVNGGEHGPSPTAASKATMFVKNLWRKSQGPSPSSDSSQGPPGGTADPNADPFWNEFGGDGASPRNSNETNSSSRFSSSQENGHISMEFADETTKFFCKIYYAEEFRKMRELIFPSGEDRFIRSLARCVKFEAKGGKSRAMFLKTYEDRLIMKQVQMVEITSFVEIAPKYFQHVTDAIENTRPLVLAKILGAYSIGFRNSKTGRSKRHHVIIMENLLFGHHCSKVFDLKGSMRGRYVTHNPKKDSKGDVLMDENFLEYIYSNPVYVWPHSKSVLMRAISADTQFLADSHIMDYSLLTAIDEEKGEVVVGVIDFVRPFTFDKRLEMYIKKAGRSILPTVVYPSLYRRRFMEAMERYFTPVPDKWTGLGADVNYY